MVTRRERVEERGRGTAEIERITVFDAEDIRRRHARRAEAFNDISGNAPWDGARARRPQLHLLGRRDGRLLFRLGDKLHHVVDDRRFAAEGAGEGPHQHDVSDTVIEDEAHVAALGA